MPQNRKKILAAVDDLFFTVKISDAARRAGLDIEYVKTEDAALAKAHSDSPALLIVDLNARSLEPIGLIAKFKGNSALKSISVIGFVSHVEGETKQKAQDAGANMVLARSAFSTNLPQILKRHAGSY